MTWPKITVEHLPGGRVVATSEDIPGLMVTAANAEELPSRVARAVKELFGATPRCKWRAGSGNIWCDECGIAYADDRPKITCPIVYP